jgi:arginyl-tRNA synthetase
MCAVRAVSWAVVAALVGAVCADARAQQSASLASIATRFAQASTPTAAGLPAATVFGFVWDASDDPIPFANVRLRNATTGRVEANAVAADNGEFTFQGLEGGTYVIEYVSANGRVLAVGHVFSVAPGEAVATFIRLRNRTPWMAALFGSAGSVAATVVSAAASIGVTALAPTSRPVSAEH